MAAPSQLPVSPPAHPAPRLLLACALAVERAALRAGARRAVPGEAAPAVLRTGMGGRAARRAVAQTLGREPFPGAAAVLATGFCAGLAPGMRPGDLVVASETREDGAAIRCSAPEALAAALAPYGTVHTGPLAGTQRLVRGAARATLRAGGAIAADMESAATLDAARAVRPRAPDGAPRPVAAVRVVVDAPGHELVRIGTLRGGISAYRTLRDALPAFIEWHRSLLLPRR
ncbi:1-hydroxy-2-methyl-2-butenyl 4-diphosphate reductase [Streptomyces sp. AJS327]|uniref:phosphorylase family protein n=1 Tax=Streptomyces sp. AJS327 TaxID=2545265 RepID=UPI0015DEA3DB|nr:1-hydroxy-2-methyl-2-butenyl 4-diphosphate reductase [Streptomyces sp. AJS327]MBA0052292.1 1-hydroxy-2-methyl-2-butenyl 4-diphosphate reductase [Streptomyces sp. AJS327]